MHLLHLGYDTGYYLADAIERAGEADPEENS